MHYNFVSESEFDELVATDGLLEWAVVHGKDRYGTPAAPVRAAVAAGRRVILEIEVQGARQVKQRLPRGPDGLHRTPVVGDAEGPAGRARYRDAGTDGPPAPHRGDRTRRSLRSSTMSS